MRISFIKDRLELEGWTLDNSEYNKFKATKEDLTIVADSWNVLYFSIHKPKKDFI